MQNKSQKKGSRNKHSRNICHKARWALLSIFFFRKVANIDRYKEYSTFDKFENA